MFRHCSIDYKEVHNCEYNFRLVRTHTGLDFDNPVPPNGKKRPNPVWGIPIVYFVLFISGFHLLEVLRLISWWFINLIIPRRWGVFSESVLWASYLLFMRAVAQVRRSQIKSTDIPELGKPCPRKAERASQTYQNNSRALARMPR